MPVGLCVSACKGMVKEDTVHLWKWGDLPRFLNKILELKLITSFAALPSLFFFFALTK